jgi:hypothetical protein
MSEIHAVEATRVPADAFNADGRPSEAVVAVQEISG